MLVFYFCECHFSGRATPLLYGACSFNCCQIKDINVDLKVCDLLQLLYCGHCSGTIVLIFRVYTLSRVDKE